METTSNQDGWLPKLNPALAPRLQAVLLPGSIREGFDSVEPLFDAILEDSRQNGITDIHLEPYSKGWRVRVRVDGLMNDVSQLEPETGLRLVRYIRANAKLDPVASFVPQDASLRFRTPSGVVDLRLTSVPCFGGEKIALRLLEPTRLRRSIRDLGLEDALVK